MKKLIFLAFICLSLIVKGQEQPKAYVGSKTGKKSIVHNKLKRATGIVIKGTEEKIIVSSFDMQVELLEAYSLEDIITGEKIEYLPVQTFHSSQAYFDCEMRLILCTLDFGEVVRFYNIKATGQESKKEYILEDVKLTLVM